MSVSGAAGCFRVKASVPLTARLARSSLPARVLIEFGLNFANGLHSPSSRRRFPPLSPEFTQKHSFRLQKGTFYTNVSCTRRGVGALIRPLLTPCLVARLLTASVTAGFLPDAAVFTVKSRLQLICLRNLSAFCLSSHSLIMRPFKRYRAV